MGGYLLKIGKELLKGSTTTLILATLLKGDKYGYQIISELRETSKNAFDLKEGTIYPILHNLEATGAIVSYWEETKEGRKRKYYNLTSKGREILTEKKREWDYFTSSVNHVIGGVLKNEV